MADGYFVVVPARFGSERLPGKPLIDLGGIPMVVRVAQRARLAQAEVVVATDHPDIFAAAREHGLDAEMTSPEHLSGSDRVMEVAARRDWPEDAVVVNVQGDEPLIPPAVIRQVSRALHDDPGTGAVTLCEPVHDPTRAADPNVVKVVRRADGCALYFSRAAVPHVRDAAGEPAPWLRHIGLYGYRLRVLRQFVSLSPSSLERLERLEQLRLLENGVALKVLTACESVPEGVDTDADVARVRELLARE